MAMHRIRDEEINEMVMESDDAYEEHLRSDSAGNDIVQVMILCLVIATLNPPEHTNQVTIPTLCVSDSDDSGANDGELENETDSYSDDSDRHDSDLHEADWAEVTQHNKTYFHKLS
jgi:hypothetical protein